MQHFMSYEKKTNSFNTSNNTSNNNNNEDMLKQFPKIKFSYESKPYKKVSQNNKSQCNTNDSNNNSDITNEIYFIIPKGKKYFAWFKNNECFFFRIGCSTKNSHHNKKKCFSCISE